MEKILKFYPRDKSEKVKRTYDISLDSYNKMCYLSKNIYDATLSDIAVASIRYLIEHENLTIRTTDKKEDLVRCNFTLTENLLAGLERLNNKYPDFSISSLVNIAISNALKLEQNNLVDYKEDE